MRRNACLITTFFLVAGLTFIAPAYGEETKEGEVSDQIASFNGLWVGSGVYALSHSQYVGCPAGKKIPISFYVIDGKARSTFTNTKASFETKIKKNGKIKFTYRDVGWVDRGEGGRDSLSIIFRGKLEGSSGTGRFTLGKCKGEWEVHRQE